MITLGAIICVALLVGTAFVRGHTTKMTTQLRLACGMMINEEKRLRGECDQIEILMESANSRRDGRRGFMALASETSGC